MRQRLLAPVLATIAVAAIRQDGRIGAEVYRDLREGVTPAMITAAIEHFVEEREVQVVAYDATSGGAGEFEGHTNLRGEGGQLAERALRLRGAELCVLSYSPTDPLCNLGDDGVSKGSDSRSVQPRSNPIAHS